VEAQAEGPSRGGASTCKDAAGNELSSEQRRADALVLVAESALAGGLDPGTRGDRYQVVVHVDAPVLADPAEQGVSALSDGKHVLAGTRDRSSPRRSFGNPLRGFPKEAAETSRRLACDAAKVVITHDQDGSVLDVGRKTRTISPSLRRALTDRDRGCRFPGCGLKHTDAHHIRHWADGGETSLDNTLLLCRHHHRLVHEETFQVKRLASGDVEFRRPDGRLLPAAPMPPPNGGIDPAVAIAKRLQDGAIVIGPYTGTPTWDGTRVDLPLAVEWFLDATSRTPNASPASDGRRPDLVQ
jgi:hypothetical protein